MGSMHPNIASTRFHSQELVHVDVRPKRAAYLIHPSSQSQFRKAISHASSRWGGIQELIVPVTRGGRISPAHQQFIDANAPDVVYAIATLTRNGESRIRAATGQEPQPISRELRNDSGTHIHDVLSHSERAAITVGAIDNGSLTHAAGAGLFTPFDVRDRWPAAYAEPDDGHQQLANAQLNGSTLIQRTGTRCGYISTTNLFSDINVLWIVDSPKMEELIWFWNLRALASATEGKWAIADLQTSRSPDFRWAFEVWLRTGKRGITEPTSLICSQSVDRSLLFGLRKRLGLSRPPENTLRHHFGRSDSGVLSAGVNWDPRQFILGETSSGSRSTINAVFESPTSKIRVEGPVEHSSSGGRVRVRVSGPTFMNVPRRSGTAELFHRDATWKGRDLELEMNMAPRYEIDLTIPGHQEVLDAALRSRGIRYAVSSPGQLASAVLNLLGTSAAPLFTDMTTIEIALSLTTPRSKQIARAIGLEIGKSDIHGIERIVSRLLGSTANRTFKSLSDISSVTGLSVSHIAPHLRTLVAHRLVSRGLRIKCKECTLESFVDLASSRPSPLCPACESPVTYSTNSSNTEPEFRYRLNALLDRASDQGVLSHLYGAERLRQELDSPHLILGADLRDLAGEDFAEIDLLGFAGDKLLVGEAKYRAGDFTERQLRRDVSIGARIGADIQVLICLEIVDKVALDLFESLCADAGTQPLVFHP